MRARSSQNSLRISELGNMTIVHMTITLWITYVQYVNCVIVNWVITQTVTLCTNTMQQAMTSWICRPKGSQTMKSVGRKHFTGTGAWKPIMACIATAASGIDLGIDASLAASSSSWLWDCTRVVWISQFSLTWRFLSIIFYNISL